MLRYGMYGRYYGRILTEHDISALSFCLGEQPGKMDIMKKIRLERLQEESKEWLFLPVPFFDGIA